MSKKLDTMIEKEKKLITDYESELKEKNQTLKALLEDKTKV